MNTFVEGVLIGVMATACIDLWSLFLRWAFEIRSLDYCLLGRWGLHIPAGRWKHESIAASAPRPAECGAGWALHYGIGVSLGVAFTVIAPQDWIDSPTLLLPLFFGLVTVSLPFLVMQPAIGLGIASSRARNPWAARLKSIGTHAVFGLGLYLGALLLRP